RDWWRRGLIVVAGGLLPVGYEIFRMGYYGLLVPGTALAKDATRRHRVADPQRAAAGDHHHGRESDQQDRGRPQQIRRIEVGQ
ncbi:hypothetical protein BST36_30700, partial [Mycolicibacterium moriokaense]|uniref:hypothetical protein n=1 Tax=Mycolicibacterium moriokaense TaxID=39691 RepID=UPI000A0A6FD7